MILAERLQKKRFWKIQDEARISQKYPTTKLNVPKLNTSKHAGAKWEKLESVRTSDIKKCEVYKINFWELI